MTFCHAFNTAFGFGAILFSMEPFAVQRIILPLPQKKELAFLLQEATPVNPLKHPKALALAELIEKYFSDGTPICAEWSILDFGSLTPLQISVLKTVKEVPFGATRNYKQIALQIGKPRSQRFVGATLARNPLPIIVPCHRIVCSDGSLGGFSGGIELKQKMLKLEAEFVKSH